MITYSLNKSNNTPIISCRFLILLSSNKLDKGNSAPCLDNKKQKPAISNSNLDSARLATRISNKVAFDLSWRDACCRAI